jgi:hypothetical protein
MRSSSIIIRTIKSISMRYAGHATSIGETTNTDNRLVGKLEERGYLR